MISVNENRITLVNKYKQVITCPINHLKTARAVLLLVKTAIEIRVPPNDILEAIAVLADKSGLDLGDYVIAPKQSSKRGLNVSRNSTYKRSLT